MIKEYFYGRKIIWTKMVRIFCDSGRPVMRYVPRFRRMHYDKHWNMYGFAMYWFGREFNFSFGEDVKGLYHE